MGYGDWIFLGVLLVVAIIGALLGFGKVLKFLTKGIIGLIISVFLCYTFGGIILDWPFVSGMLADLASHWSNIGFLSLIRLEIIIYYIGLFLVFTLLRILIVGLIGHISESDLLVMKIFNKVGGALLFTLLAFLLLFFVFQIIHWIGGNTAANFSSLLEMNCNAIVRPIYEGNPMNALVEFLRKK